MDGTRSWFDSEGYYPAGSGMRGREKLMRLAWEVMVAATRQNEATSEETGEN